MTLAKLNKRYLLYSLGWVFVACAGSAKISHGNDASASVFHPNNLTTTSAQISAATGGYINVGSAQLRIPAQALDSDTMITAEIADISLPAGSAKAVGKGIRLKPEGLQFLNPAELEICYSGAEAAALNESNAQIYYHTEDNQYVAIAGTVDVNRHCVKSHIEHFSSYVAAAVAQVPGNTAPVIGGANFLPATPMAGIPLRVRTAINDTNGSTPIGSTVPGTVVTAFFYYRAVGASTFNKVALQPDNTDDTVTNRYYYQIPANEVTTAGIEYYFEATDNLNVVRRLPATVGTYSTRTVPSAATAIRFNPAGLTPAGELQISAGFMRALTLQATSDGTTWQNIAIDNAVLSNPALGTTAISGPSSVRFKALGAISGNISSTSGAFSAVTNIAVVPGLLTHIEITDLNQVILSGTINLPAGQTYNFDVIGFDAFGNISSVLPLLTTTGGIGAVSVDLTGAHFTASGSASAGSIIADIAGLTDTLSVSLYVPPQITATAPFDNTAGIAVNASIGVSFSHIMDTSTLTTTTTSVCTGSLQVSSDNFATCIPMASATPAFYASNTLAVIQPAANLAGLTTYKIRVKASVLDTNNHPIVSDYTTPVGFTTVPVPPFVVSADPADEATSVAVSTAISITFSQAMNPATLTATTTSACSGSIQLSVDNFATCIPMSTTTAGMTVGNTVATLTPAASLTGAVTYKIRVTTAATSALGILLANNFSQVTGFTTQLSLPAGWYSVASGTTNNLNAVAFVPNTNIAYAVGDLGIVVKSDDQGETWLPVATAPVDAHYSLKFSSSTDGILTSAAHIYTQFPRQTQVQFLPILQTMRQVSAGHSNHQ
ncbi:MAG: Ig-like domain-containing protein [Turneriella sp.]